MHSLHERSSSQCEPGCFGASNVENAFTIIANERTLELEAPSQSEKKDWLAALQYLMEQVKSGSVQ